MSVALICATFVDFAVADDWPMYGRDVTHNAVSLEINPVMFVLSGFSPLPLDFAALAKRSEKPFPHLLWK